MEILNSHQENYLQTFIENYNKKTLKSKLQAENARNYLADPRGVAGFKITTKELLYPIIGKSGKGSRFVDIDDNEYIDISMGFGALLFGHTPEFVQIAFQNQITSGVQLGPQAALTHEVARLICEMTGVDKIAFCNTGTEAIMTAIRLARLKSNKQKIAMFSGAYHGFYDATLGISINADIANIHPLTEGLPDKIFQDLLILEYNREEDISKLKQYVNDLACIIIEPVRGRFPGIQSKTFLELVRTFADKNNIILIFDEVVTGFRSHPGGAQAYFGVNADLVVYGKSLAAGLPIGVVGGKADIMSGIDGGNWNYGDLSYPRESTTFFAGTFNKNPLTISAAYAFLNEIKKRGENLQLQLSNKTQYIVEKLNEYFEEEKVSITVSRFSSLFRFDIKDNADIFYYHLIYNNLYVWEGRSFYISEAHTEEDLNCIINSVKKSTEILKLNKLI